MARKHEKNRVCLGLSSISIFPSVIWLIHLRRHWTPCAYEYECVRGSHIWHHSYVIMSAMASQITSLTIVYSIADWGADQRKHQSSASLAFVRGIHRWPVNSPHKEPVTRKLFPFDDVNMIVMKNSGFDKYSYDKSCLTHVMLVKCNLPDLQNNRTSKNISPAKFPFAVFVSLHDPHIYASEI